MVGGGKEFGEELATRIDELQEPLRSGELSWEDHQRFYDFIAPPEIAGVVHSMKADAIRSSGSEKRHKMT